MTRRAPQKGGRLGTQMRSKLQKDQDQRGHSRYALWYAYSPKAAADVVLYGDLRYGHFLLTESDPEVESVSYAPRNRVAAIAGAAFRDYVDADVQMRDGTHVWRCVTASESSQAKATALANLNVLIEHRIHAELPARVEVVTEVEIYAQPERIRNWSRLLPWVAQAREWPLHEHGNLIGALVRARGEVTLADVFALVETTEKDPEGQRGLFGAALLQALQYGRLCSDLNERAFSLASRFWVPRRES